MWYENENNLDLSKPICADGPCGETYLLLPHNKDNSYYFRGYDWFHTESGTWNSCRNFKTIEEALITDYYTNIRNCEVSIA